MVYSVLFCDIRKDVCERMLVSTYELYVESYVHLYSCTSYRATSNSFARCVTWRARDVADVPCQFLTGLTLSEPGFYIEEFRYVLFCHSQGIISVTGSILGLVVFMAYT